MANLSDIKVTDVLDALGAGVYVCDLDRTVTYWSPSAERITGWTAEEVVGRKCSDNVLCHVDKDGHALCGKEHCPLHRSMVTGRASGASMLVFANTKDGRRLPVQVDVAPIRDDEGNVVGGLETFRDASEVVADLKKARRIQALAMAQDLPADERVQFTTHYLPHGIIGGDWLAVAQIDEHRYGVVLADVTGHGIAAGLYTMHLSQLWDRFKHLLAEPSSFAARVNRELASVAKGDTSFAAAVCGLLDLERGVFRVASAGGPQVLHFRPDGSYQAVDARGLPMGIVPDAIYEETVVDVEVGDRLLLVSDGAVEVRNAASVLIGEEGLVDLLRRRGYPEADLIPRVLEEDLLRYSDAIRLEDDLSLIEIACRAR